MSDRIAFWVDPLVPGGSKLVISVTGSTPKKLVTAHPFLLRGDGIEQSFPDGAVQPGPLTIKLESPHTYSILTDLVFTTSGTAEVTAELIAPNKKRIGPDNVADAVFKSSVAGSEGQTLGLTFFIATATK
jgi:hypothetical protein